MVKPNIRTTYSIENCTRLICHRNGDDLPGGQIRLSLEPGNPPIPDSIIPCELVTKRDIPLGNEAHSERPASQYELHFNQIWPHRVIYIFAVAADVSRVEKPFFPETIMDVDKAA